MTEAVFARKQVEDFTLPQIRGRVTFRLTEFAGLTQDVFMSDRPGNARYRYGQNEQPRELRGQERHSR